jgi:PLD-like domain
MHNIIQNSQTGKVWIKSCVSNGLERADICSAYMRSEAFKFFFEDLFSTDTKIRVLARWTLDDLLSQASDLRTYELCRSKNIDFYIKQDFHGKLYNLAPHGILIGSFNLTNRGFSIHKAGNDEAGVLIENNKDSSDYFDQLFFNAIKVDDNLYEKLSKYVAVNLGNNELSISWSDEILQLLTPYVYDATEKILVYECLASTFSDFMHTVSDARLHDISLLSLEDKDCSDLIVIRDRFKRLKIYRWFCEALRVEEGEVYFQSLTDKK